MNLAGGRRETGSGGGQYKHLFLPELIYLVLCFANLLKGWKSQGNQHDCIHQHQASPPPSLSLYPSRCLF